MRRPLPPIAAALLLGLAVPASAHHSTAMFDWKQETVVEGVVSRVEWTNPHVFVYLSSKAPGGKVSQFVFEGMSPNHLSRHGWTKHSVEVGDKVTIGYHPLRDKRPGGFCTYVTKADGTRLEQLPTTSG